MCGKEFEYPDLPTEGFYGKQMIPFALCPKCRQIYHVAICEVKR